MVRDSEPDQSVGLLSPDGEAVGPPSLLDSRPRRQPLWHKAGLVLSLALNLVALVLLLWTNAKSQPQPQPRTNNLLYSASCFIGQFSQYYTQDLLVQHTGPAQDEVVHKVVHFHRDEDETVYQRSPSSEVDIAWQQLYVCESSSPFTSYSHNRWDCLLTHRHHNQ
jgi:hypothetical protein